MDSSHKHKSNIMVEPVHDHAKTDISPRRLFRLISVRIRTDVSLRSRTRPPCVVDFPLDLATFPGPSSLLHLPHKRGMYTSMIIAFLRASRNTYCIYECIHHHQHEILPKKINYRRVLGILFSRLQSCTLSEFFPNK